MLTIERKSEKLTGKEKRRPAGSAAQHHNLSFVMHVFDGVSIQLCQTQYKRGIMFACHADVYSRDADVHNNKINVVKYLKVHL